MIKIAVFASGGGSNARAICTYFDKHISIRVGLIITNNPKAGAIHVADYFGIPVQTITNKQLFDSEFLHNLLKYHSIEYIVLAGFLKLIPVWLIAAYPNKILNIHPSLLPKYGGKGMYGMHVHEAVKANGESESGMTVHVVNNEFDKGEILFQAKTKITEDMQIEDIAAAVLKLEHTFFSVTIEKFINGYFKPKE